MGTYSAQTPCQRCVASAMQQHQIRPFIPCCVHTKFIFFDRNVLFFIKVIRPGQTSKTIHHVGLQRSPPRSAHPTSWPFLIFGTRRSLKKNDRAKGRMCTKENLVNGITTGSCIMLILFITILSIGSVIVSNAHYSELLGSQIAEVGGGTMLSRRHNIIMVTNNP